MILSTALVLALVIRTVSTLVSGWTFLFCTLLYALWYTDGKEYTGERRWPWLRSWRISNWRAGGWGRAVTRHINNRTQLAAAVPRLYMMAPCDSVASAFWTIGLHGGEMDGFGDRLHWIAPRILLRVPLLRDVLMWAGAVTPRPGATVEDALLELMQSRRSVCWCPSNFASVVLDEFAQESDLPDDGDLESAGVVSVAKPSSALLEFLVAHRIDVVPVALHNERRRYWVARWPWLRWVQRRTHALLGYPIPQLRVLRVGWPPRPPKRMQLQVGGVIHSGDCADGVELWTAVGEAFAAITCTAVNDARIEFIQDAPQ